LNIGENICFSLFHKQKPAQTDPMVYVLDGSNVLKLLTVARHIYQFGGILVRLLDFDHLRHYFGAEKRIHVRKAEYYRHIL
jgi:hypothetical protein